MPNDKEPYEKYRISGKKKDISKEKPQISKAPPPFKGVSGSSPPRLECHKPDWEYWKHFTKIKLWEAAFLCNDIDPRNQEYRDIGTPRYEKVKNYLDFLRDNFDLLDFYSISLSEIAVWALEKNHEIPDELATFAKNTDENTEVQNEKKQAPQVTITNHKEITKQRRNILDPIIDEAIKEAQCDDTQKVWLEVKELALKGENPFTGEIEGEKLLYTSGKNKIESFTIDLLRKRLKYRKQLREK